MYQLARERIDLQSKLGELQTLVVKLLGERNMLYSYQTQTAAASTPAPSPSVPSPTKRRRRTKPAHSDDNPTTDGQPHVLLLLLFIIQGGHWSWKVVESPGILEDHFPGLEGHGKTAKVTESRGFYGIFTTALRNFVM